MVDSLQSIKNSISPSIRRNLLIAALITLLSEDFMWSFIVLTLNVFILSYKWDLISNSYRFMCPRSEETILISLFSSIIFDNDSKRG